MWCWHDYLANLGNYYTWHLGLIHSPKIHQFSLSTFKNAYISIASLNSDFIASMSEG